MDNTATITQSTLVALTSQPAKWITVIRRGSTQAEVLRYVNDWPTFEMTEGMYLVCIPASQTWIADRLGSGLFYAKVHDTQANAERDAVDNADLVMPR